MKKVKVLKVLDGIKPSLAISRGETATTNSEGGAGLTTTNSGLKRVADFLENRLYIPVLDETGLTGAYDLHLEWLNENPNAIYAALNKFGLELVDRERRIDVLVISDK